MTIPQLELVNTEAHKTLRINPKKVNVPENQVNACIVVAGELSSLIHEYPIFITKDQKRDQYQLTAILGLHSGDNLYLDGEQWRATYLPLDILRKPFQAFIPDPNHTSKGSIAIDINSPAVSETTGQRLFTDRGESTDYFKRIETTFKQLMSGTQYTADLLRQAVEFDLLEQVDLKFDLANSEPVTLNGLYIFSQDKVTALKGDALEQCHQSGLLQVCHLTMASSLHLNKLINWYQENNTKT